MYQYLDKPFKTEDDSGAEDFDLRTRHHRWTWIEVRGSRPRYLYCQKKNWLVDQNGEDWCNVIFIPAATTPIIIDLRKRGRARSSILERSVVLVHCNILAPETFAVDVFPKHINDNLSQCPNTCIGSYGSSRYFTSSSESFTWTASVPSNINIRCIS